MTGRWMVLVWMGLAMVAMPARALADASWLDTQPPVNWNAAGMSVPAAQPDEWSTNRAFCARSIRPAETDDDFAVIDAGWSLVGSYEAGWGINAVLGTTGFDGMCRPMGFQQFVFVDGVFAGTISPVTMESRTSGAGRIQSLSDDQLYATFVRYADTDALCCPSLPSASVQYRIDTTEAGPVVVPVQVIETM